MRIGVIFNQKGEKAFREYELNVNLLEIIFALQNGDFGSNSTVSIPKNRLSMETQDSVQRRSVRDTLSPVYSAGYVGHRRDDRTQMGSRDGDAAAFFLHILGGGSASQRSATHATAGGA